MPLHTTQFLCPERQNQLSVSTAKDRRSRNVEFIICNSCFWCSSLIRDNLRSTHFELCPCCKSSMIESMPIAPNDEYSFHMDEKSGVVLEFRYLNHEGKKEGK